MEIKHFFINNYQSILFALVAIFCIIRLQKWWRSSSKRRQMKQKIGEFRRAEAERRRQIRARHNGVKEVDAVTSLPFIELRRKLATGEMSASQVLHAYQTAALKTTEQTNAVTEFVASAEVVARKLDEQPKNERKPLHGIPISVKECCFIQGTESTEGHGQYLGRFNDHETAPIVEFLESLGCVAFVKSNLPQAMMSFDSRNGVHGITKNPHNLHRSPGGSTSGEGALVGARASILGVGSDAGGSLRIPAAWCGCFTMKPTSGRMLHGSSFPSQVYFPRSIVRDFNAMGFITRDVETLVMLHRLLYSSATFDRYLFNMMAPVPFRDEVFHSTRPLTIGFCDSDGVIETVPAMKRAIHLTKEALERRGHRLVEWKAPRVREAFLLYLRTMTVDGTVEVIKAIEEDVEICFPNKTTIRMSKLPHWLKRTVASFARPFIGDLPADVLRSVRVGRHPHETNVEFQQIRKYRRDFAKAFSSASLDALLWPAFACPALPLNSPRDSLAALSYTILFNMIDWPAGVLPVTKVSADDEAKMTNYPGHRDIFHRAVKKGLVADSQGLPVAVQVAAPQYREEVVLRIMSEINSQNVTK